MTPGAADDVAIVTLRPMTEEEFTRWSYDAPEVYAEQMAAAGGVSMDVAIPRAHAEFSELLPDGLETDGMSLLTVLNMHDEAVGMLWLGPHRSHPNASYVYNIEIDSPHRGHGFGRAAMIAAENFVAASGFAEIGLNVAGVNLAARQLYGSLGYRVIDIQLSKTLSS